MTCCAPDGEETFLMPLKKRKNLPCPGDGQSLREKRCEPGPDKCGELRPRRSSVCEAEVDNPATQSCFEDSVEWQSTKCVAEGLFRALGQHYDQPWFPTVVNEWSALYYQCNHTADYWLARDEWLAGDEEVRLTIWSEVLGHREQHKRQLEQLNQNVLCDTGKCDPNADLMDVHDGCAAKVPKTHGSPNKANDRFDLLHKDEEQFCGDNSADERARLEAEAAEIALADPDDDPDWVQMRRKMRGSFASLNVAQCEVSAELLDHIMMELCKYWANASVCDDSCLIDPQLERNIMREIQNFRFKIFGVAVEIEPELQQSGQDACQEPEPCREPEPSCMPEPKPCRKPEPRCTPEPQPCRKPEPRCTPEPQSCRKPEPRCTPEPEPCRKPEPRCTPEPQTCRKPEPRCTPEPQSCRKPEPRCTPEPQSCRKPEPRCTPEPVPCRKPEPRCTPEPQSCRKPEPRCTPEPVPCRELEPCCPRNPKMRCPRGPEPYCSQEPVPCCPPLPPPKPKCCAPRRSSKTKVAEARARHNATQVRDRDVSTGWLRGRPNP